VFEDNGYAPLFAYGGYGYFDNMNAFFDANDYRSIDRRSHPGAGHRVRKHMGRRRRAPVRPRAAGNRPPEKDARPQRPVFVHIMTTSNHRPYTYPPGRIDIPSGTGREGA